MIIYYAPALFLLVSLVFLFVKAKAVDLILAILLIIFVSVVTGSHYFSVSDYENYFDLYKIIPEIDIFKFSDLKYYYGEVGFVYLVSMLKYLKIPFIAFTLILSCISISLKCYFYFKLNRKPLYSVSIYLCLYFILVEFILIRWSVAVGLIVVGYYFIFTNKNIYSKFFLAFSFLFHYFSLIFIVASFFAKKFYSFRCYFTLMVISFLISSVVSISDVSLISSFNTSVTTKIAFYLLEVDTTVGLISRVKVLFYSFFILLYLASVPRNSLDENLKFLINNSMIFIFLSILFFEFPALFQRTTIITDIFCIATIVRIIEIKYSKNALGLFGVLSSLSIFFIVWLFLDVSNSFNVRVWDYKSWFDFMWYY